eukprot:gene21759-41893_t
MGRHERLVPKFAQKKSCRSEGRGACMHPRGCFGRSPDVSDATLSLRGAGSQATVTFLGTASSAGSTLTHRLRQRLQHRHGLVEADASIGDGHAVLQWLAELLVLP